MCRGSAIGVTVAGDRLARLMVAARTLVALAALLLSLALPAAATAQGAGDEQYQDPFGDEQSQQEPAPTPEPAEPAPAAPPAAAPAQSAPPPAATPAQSGDQLPYTGADAGLLALAGAVLLSAGIALRRRADHQR
jgi:LPXTG-motif cell wall-anchored protein